MIQLMIQRTYDFFMSLFFTADRINVFDVVEKDIGYGNIQYKNTVLLHY